MPGAARPQPLRPSTNGTAHGRGLGVVLVDQEPLFRDGLSALIAHTAGLRWLGATPNVHAAVMVSRRLRADVVIIDAAMDPRGHLVKLLTDGGTALTVVTLVRAPCRTEQYVSDVVNAGAHGVMLRSVEPRSMLEGIHRAYTERRFIDPGLSALTRCAADARQPGAKQPLSRREHQVLALIADGLDNQGIGRELYVSVETVRTHVKSILRKLHARDRAHAVSVAYRVGILVPHAFDAPAIDQAVR